jgi:hypothetical protein
MFGSNLGVIVKQKEQRENVCLFKDPQHEMAVALDGSQNYKEAIIQCR